ncbi:hypothetical protein HY970_02055, partial [Candidatus Kaiserbacteria bacterium]|nr:hypothetical protein [Candidatus Kaiserbacteria bacterium]
MNRAYTAPLFLVGAICFSLILVPALLRAQTITYNSDCRAAWVYTVKCGEKEKDASGKETGKIGGKGCVCDEISNGKTVKGTCVKPLQCMATQTAEGETPKQATTEQKQNCVGGPCPIIPQTTSPTTQPTPQTSMWDQALFNPTPIAEQKPTPPSATNFEQTIKDSPQPGFFQELKKDVSQTFRDLISFPNGSTPSQLTPPSQVPDALGETKPVSTQTTPISGSTFTNNPIGGAETPVGGSFVPKENSWLGNVKEFTGNIKSALVDYFTRPPSIPPAPTNPEAPQNPPPAPPSEDKPVPRNEIPRADLQGPSADTLRKEMEEIKNNQIDPVIERIQKSNTELERLAKEAERIEAGRIQFRDRNIVAVDTDGKLTFGKQEDVNAYRQLTNNSLNAYNALKTETISNDLLRSQLKDDVGEFNKLVTQYSELPGSTKMFDAFQNSKLDAQERLYNNQQEIDKIAADVKARFDANRETFKGYTPEEGQRNEFLRRENEELEKKITTNEKLISFMLTDVRGDTFADTMIHGGDPTKTALIQEVLKLTDEQTRLARYENNESVDSKFSRFLGDSFYNWNHEAYIDPINRGNDTIDQLLGLKRMEPRVENTLDSIAGNTGIFAPAHEFAEYLHKVQNAPLSEYGVLSKIGAYVGSAVVNPALGVLGEPPPSVQLARISDSPTQRFFDYGNDVAFTALNATIIAQPFMGLRGIAGEALTGIEGRIASDFGTRATDLEFTQIRPGVYGLAGAPEAGAAIKVTGNLPGPLSTEVPLASVEPIPVSRALIPYDAAVTAGRSVITDAETQVAQGLRETYRTAGIPETQLPTWAQERLGIPAPETIAERAGVKVVESPPIVPESPAARPVEPIAPIEHTASPISETPAAQPVRSAEPAPTPESPRIALREPELQIPLFEMKPAPVGDVPALRPVDATPPIGETPSVPAASLARESGLFQNIRDFLFGPKETVSPDPLSPTEALAISNFNTALANFSQPTAPTVDPDLAAYRETKNAERVSEAFKGLAEAGLTQRPTDGVIVRADTKDPVAYPLPVQVPGAAPYAVPQSLAPTEDTIAEAKAVLKEEPQTRFAKVALAPTPELSIPAPSSVPTRPAPSLTRAITPDDIVVSAPARWWDPVALATPGTPAQVAPEIVMAIKPDESVKVYVGDTDITEFLPKGYTFVRDRENACDWENQCVMIATSPHEPLFLRDVLHEIGHARNRSDVLISTVKQIGVLEEIKKSPQGLTTVQEQRMRTLEKTYVDETERSERLANLEAFKLAEDLHARTGVQALGTGKNSDSVLSDVLYNYNTHKLNLGDVTEYVDKSYIDQLFERGKQETTKAFNESQLKIAAAIPVETPLAPTPVQQVSPILNSVRAIAASIPLLTSPMTVPATIGTGILADAVLNPANAARRIVPQRNIAFDLDVRVGVELAHAAVVVCKAYGCDGTTYAQAIAASCVQESHCNPTTPHRGSRYQGLGQLSRLTTETAYNNLIKVRNSTAVTPIERQKIDQVLVRTRAWIDRNPKAADPRFNPVDGAWLFAARHMEMGPPEWGKTFYPIRNIQAVAPGDPRTQGYLIQVSGQLAPSLNVNGLNLDQPLGRAVLRALCNNKICGATTLRQALVRMKQMRGYGTNIPRGTAWMQTILNSNIPPVWTAGPIAVPARIAELTPALTAGKPIDLSLELRSAIVALWDNPAAGPALAQPSAPLASTASAIPQPTGPTHVDIRLPTAELPSGEQLTQEVQRAAEETLRQELRLAMEELDYRTYGPRSQADVEIMNRKIETKLAQESLDYKVLGPKNGEQVSNILEQSLASRELDYRLYGPKTQEDLAQLFKDAETKLAQESLTYPIFGPRTQQEVAESIERTTRVAELRGALSRARGTLTVDYRPFQILFEQRSPVIAVNRGSDIEQPNPSAAIERGPLPDIQNSRTTEITERIPTPDAVEVTGKQLTRDIRDAIAAQDLSNWKRIGEGIAHAWQGVKEYAASITHGVELARQAPISPTPNPVPPIVPVAIRPGTPREETPTNPSETTPASEIPPVPPTPLIEVPAQGAEVQEQLAWLQNIGKTLAEVPKNVWNAITSRIPSAPEPTYQPITPLPPDRALILATHNPPARAPSPRGPGESLPTMYVTSDGVAMQKIPSGTPSSVEAPVLTPVYNSAGWTGRGEFVDMNWPVYPLDTTKIITLTEAQMEYVPRPVPAEPERTLADLYTAEPTPTRERTVADLYESETAPPVGAESPTPASAPIAAVPSFWQRAWERMFGKKSAEPTVADLYSESGGTRPADRRPLAGGGSGSGGGGGNTGGGARGIFGGGTPPGGERPTESIGPKSYLKDALGGFILGLSGVVIGYTTFGPEQIANTPSGPTVPVENPAVATPGSETPTIAPPAPPETPAPYVPFTLDD